MTALNLEVDPKRIEAHENEEPPAYEPTDEDGIATVSASKTKKKFMQDGHGDGGFEGEVVEEDAEEERRAEALATAKAGGSSSNNNDGTATNEKSYEDPSFWSTEQDEAEAVEQDPGMDSDPFASGEGPSMDDFFHDDSFGDDEDPSSIKSKAAEGSAGAGGHDQAPHRSSRAVSVDEGGSASVSLVPKKVTSKSRRKKIRPSARRKK
mmetsp:Transcript_16866/g.38544  ORF Transcript_16866/g.38544 Transcript_16866/m.38544 type:complete len:208 (+) Transcript_16866:593-1216(+)